MHASALARHLVVVRRDDEDLFDVGRAETIHAIWRPVVFVQLPCAACVAELTRERKARQGKAEGKQEANRRGQRKEGEQEREQEARQARKREGKQASKQQARQSACNSRQRRK